MISRLFTRISTRIHGPGGYRELSAIALPLILSSGSWALYQFVDRLFLTWYSPAALAAAMPAGMLNFTLSSLFFSVAGYVAVFTAQYLGAKREECIGAAIWQGLYVALGGGLFMAALSPLAPWIFSLMGHAPEIAGLEAEYFGILCMGAFPFCAGAALSGFFSGLGRTWPILWVNIGVNVLHVLLDWLLIFGHWGFPAMGIRGAAWATVFSAVAQAVIFTVLVFMKANRSRYALLAGWRFQPALFRRLLRFGVPGGLQIFADIAAVAAFVLLVGRLGKTALAATNLAMNINGLAFMPMLGFGSAVGVLVGRYQGAGTPGLSARTVWSGVHVTLLYMACMGALYVGVPRFFFLAHAAQGDPVAFAPVADTAIILLRFVALYSLFDTGNIIFGSGLRGAGDTRFVMVVVLLLSGVVFVLPVAIGVIFFDRGLFFCWSVFTIYTASLGLTLWARFATGRWRSMKVIEEPVLEEPEPLLHRA